MYTFILLLRYFFIIYINYPTLVCNTVLFVHTYAMLCNENKNLFYHSRAAIPFGSYVVFQDLTSTEHRSCEENLCNCVMRYTTWGETRDAHWDHHMSITWSSRVIFKNFVKKAMQVNVYRSIICFEYIHLMWFLHTFEK